MPRRPRVFIEGGIYHVYNRFARGAEIFSEADNAERFLSLWRKVKARDGLTVFAWCVMSNHYHLAVRTGPVPLSRTVGSVQARFGQAYNRRTMSSGPRWQSRYKARLIEDETYLRRVVAYIHLNPVSAKLVDDPARYPYSGHRELLRSISGALVDPEVTLGIYGDTLRTARRNYRQALGAALSEGWWDKLPGSLPWWGPEPDRPLRRKAPRAWVDERGLSTGRPRRWMSAAEFLAATCRLLGFDVELISGQTYRRDVTRARMLLAAVAVERWHQSPRELSGELGRRADVVSRWVRWGAERRTTDPTFSKDYEALDQALAESTSGP